MAKSKAKKAKSSSGKSSGKGKSKPQPQITVVAENRKARHRYEIIDTLECGLMLMGSEVKSMREGKLSLDEAHIRAKDRELWLIGAASPPPGTRPPSWHEHSAAP